MATRAQLLTCLPLDEKVRAETLSRLGELSQDQQLELSKTCWKMFFQLAKDQADYEFHAALIEAGDKKQVDPKKIEEEVHKKFTDAVTAQQKFDVAPELRHKYEVMITALVKDIVQWTEVPMIDWSSVIQFSNRQVGALVVYAPDDALMPIALATIRFLDVEYNEEGFPNLTNAPIQEYKLSSGGTIRAAVFPSLEPGKYSVYKPGTGGIFKKEVRISPGVIVEVEW